MVSLYPLIVMILNVITVFLKKKTRVSSNGGTDTLITNHGLYVTTTSPVYFLVDFVGGVNNFATVSNVFTFLRYTLIA